MSSTFLCLGLSTICIIRQNFLRFSLVLFEVQYKISVTFVKRFKTDPLVCHKYMSLSYDIRITCIYATFHVELIKEFLQEFRIVISFLFNLMISSNILLHAINDSISKFMKHNYWTVHPSVTHS